MMGSASSTHDDIVATLKDAGLDPAQVRTLIEATFAEDLRWGRTSPPKRSSATNVPPPRW